MKRLPLLLAVLTSGLATLQGQQAQPRTAQDPEAFRFKGGVEVVNVTATVTDRSGRFVSGLTRDDFSVYEDDALQTVTHFGSGRAPVSLGIVLDTSGSMAGAKIAAARGAIDRFLFDLLDRDDEFFLYIFNDRPLRLLDWTTNRQAISRAIARVSPLGGTAMFDAVGEAIPLVDEGRRQKKALLVISDGNDTSSEMGIRELKRRLRESEVIVYAVGIDGDDMFVTPPRAPIGRTPPTRPIPFPPRFPVDPGRGRGRGFPGRQAPPIFQQIGPGAGPLGSRPPNDRVNVSTLREMTDESGGRTEIVHDPRDLGPATSSIANELNQQYELAYPSSGRRDGRWHAIRVEVRGGRYTVRSRQGYMAN